jgi:hypothetical protein
VIASGGYTPIFVGDPMSASWAEFIFRGAFSACTESALLRYPITLGQRNTPLKSLARRLTLDSELFCNLPTGLPHIQQSLQRRNHFVD